MEMSAGGLPIQNGHPILVDMVVVFGTSTLSDLSIFFSLAITAGRAGILTTLGCDGSPKLFSSSDACRVACRVPCLVPLYRPSPVAHRPSRCPSSLGCQDCVSWQRTLVAVARSETSKMGAPTCMAAVLGGEW